MDSAQYVDLFVSEAQDHLQAMSRALLAIEDQRRGGLAGAEDEHIPGLFRSAHTLKGMSAALGFQQIARLAHRMEDGLDLLRQKQRRLTPALADALFACLDRLTALVEAIAAGQGESGSVEAELARLDALLQAAPPEDDVASPAEAVSSIAPDISGPAGASSPAWELYLQINPDCQLKGARAFVILRRLSGLVGLLETQPPQDDLLAGSYAFEFQLLYSRAADPQALTQALVGLSEVINCRLTPLAPPPQAPASAAAPPDAPLSKPTVPEPQPAPILAPAVTEPQPDPAAPPPKPEAPAGGEAAATLVRVKVSLLDQLLEASADMVVNHSMLTQIARKHDLPDLKEALETHAVAIKRLEQVVLSMRMVPVAQVFNRFPRLVRDLALSLGKDVHFEMGGAEIELDRMILDRLADPLVHLLRNAIDHGIETPDERIQAGKAPTALVRLTAHREQDKVIIEVADDGRGLLPEAILRTALERGVVTPRQAAVLDRHAILELICVSGFSTKAQASGVSGRGVGMDVVKQSLKEMGGRLEIDSQPGQGTHFRLTCPLTMAILPSILVRCGSERYVIPLAHVVHTLEMQAGDVRWLSLQPVLPWKERMLPLFSLAWLLGAAEAPTWARNEPDSGQVLQVVIVAPGHQAYGLVVDEILGKEEIVLKPLAKYLGVIAGVSGVTVRGEGEISLVLDAAGLVQSMAAHHKGAHDV